MEVIEVLYALITDKGEMLQKNGTTTSAQPRLWMAHDLYESAEQAEDAQLTAWHEYGITTRIHLYKFVLVTEPV